MSLKLLKGHALQLLSVVSVLAFWQVSSVLAGLGDTYPPVTKVAPQLYDLLSSGQAFSPLLSTLMRTVLGFLLGFGVGMLYGILVYVSPKFGEYARGIHSIVLFSPTLIVIFLGLIMIGRTNLGVVLVTGFATSAEIGVYMRDAFRAFDREIAGMARSYHVSALSMVKDVYIPYLVPPILTTCRIGFTLAWKVTFLAEIFGFPGGLGFNVRTSYAIFDITSLLAWLAIFVIALLIIEQLIRFGERRLVRW